MNNIPQTKRLGKIKITYDELGKMLGARTICLYGCTVIGIEQSETDRVNGIVTIYLSSESFPVSCKGCEIPVIEAVFEDDLVKLVAPRTGALVDTGDE